MITIIYRADSCDYTVETPDGNSYLFKTVEQVNNFLLEYYPNAKLVTSALIRR